MGRPAALSRELIIEVAATLVSEHGAEALSARRLGEALHCDPSALYRHFADMDDVQREVGDRFLAGVKVAPRRDEDWLTAVRRICLDLRRVQLRQPRLAALVRTAPTRLTNELRITEALLRELTRGGFAPAAAAAAYHSLIELTVGSAAIDASMAADPPAARRRAIASGAPRTHSWTRRGSRMQWPSPSTSTRAAPTNASNTRWMPCWPAWLRRSGSSSRDRAVIQ